MSIVRKQNEEMEINLLEGGRLLLDHALVIIIATLLFGLAAFAGTFFLVTPQYKASATLYVNNSASGSGNDNITQSDLNASAKLVDTYAAIIKSRAVLNEVIAQAGVDISVEDLQSSISTSAVNETEVFKVTVKNPDPKASARLANAIVQVAPDQIAEIVEGSSVKIVDHAVIPTHISEPSYKKMTVFGMAFGFVLSVAIIILRALLDNTIKTEADFAQWDYPLLSTIPDLEEARKGKSGGYGYGYGNRN